MPTNDLVVRQWDWNQWWFDHPNDAADEHNLVVAHLAELEAKLQLALEEIDRLRAQLVTHGHVL